MDYLIKHSRNLLALFLLPILLYGCKDYSELDIEPVNSGDADFSTYVAVGNSLTAGFQNNALYKSAQEYSFSNLLARQINIGKRFSQPLISNPGISPGGGRIELTNLDPVQTTRNSDQGMPINQMEKPFKNLGVPGAVLVDYLNPNNTGHLKERATDPSHPAYNPFYGVVMEQSELAKDAPNIHNQVKKQAPTLITFWLGNNDVLNFVTSGGEGQAPTAPSTFAQLYQGSAQALASTGATVVLYNLPDITSIPFVFYLRLQLERQGAIAFNSQTQSYQLVTAQGSFDIYIQTDDGNRIMRQADFPLLTASDYFAKVKAGEIPPPIDANGDGTPESVIPDRLVFDGPAGGSSGSSELEQAAGAIAQHNAVIGNIASSPPFVLVDINNIFNSILSTFQTSDGQRGYQTNGLNLRPVPGELFSFDGVHPTNRGSAVITNKTIEAMNSSLNSDIPKIDVSKIPEGFPVASN